MDAGNDLAEYVDESDTGSETIKIGLFQMIWQTKFIGKGGKI
jgi:hypothetical protein